MIDVRQAAVDAVGMAKSVRTVEELRSNEMVIGAEFEAVETSLTSKLSTESNTDAGAVAAVARDVASSAWGGGVTKKLPYIELDNVPLVPVIEKL